MLVRASLLIVLLAFSSGGDVAKDRDPADLCCGLEYTSTSCPCDKTPKKQCTCSECMGGAECACVKRLRQGKGSIQGSVALRKSHRKYQTVVYIERMPGVDFAVAKKPRRMDQSGKKFVPHVLPLLVGSEVEFLNSDDFEHNVFSPDGEKYNLGNWGKGQKRSRKFEKPGVYVQLCSIHPEMMSFILVLETPYFAFVKKDGTFEIPNVPPGKWKLKVWNERFKPKILKRTFEVEAVANEASNIEIKAK